MGANNNSVICDMDLPLHVIWIGPNTIEVDGIIVDIILKGMEMGMMPINRDMSLEQKHINAICDFMDHHEDSMLDELLTFTGVKRERK